MSRPQHSKAVRLRLAPVVIGLGAVVALTGCSAGQQAETSQQVANIEGANAEAKNMAVRDAKLAFPEKGAVYPKGSSAPVDVVLINEAPTSDRLLEVSSPYAASARVSGDTTIPGRTRLYSDGEAAGSTEPSSAQQQQGGPVTKPQVNITLTGLTQDIRPGTVIPVTFTFERAGEVTVQVPIAPSPKPRPEHGSPL